MKKPICFSLLSLLFAWSAAQAEGPARGTSGAGGGDTLIVLSTPADVGAIIEDSVARFKGAFEQPKRENAWIVRGRYGLVSGMFFAPYESGKINLVGQNPEVMDLLRKIAGRVEGVVDRTRIDKKTDGPCVTADGSAKHGAVHVDDPDSSICLSVALLQQLPKSVLKIQILGLVAHEFMHKLGYGEKEAVMVQRYFIEEIASRRAELRAGFAGSIGAIGDNLKSAEFHLKGGGPLVSVCTPLDMAREGMSRLAGLMNMAALTGQLRENLDATEFRKTIDELYRGTATVYSPGATADLSIATQACMGKFSRSQIRKQIDLMNQGLESVKSKIIFYLPPASMEFRR